MASGKVIVMRRTACTMAIASLLAACASEPSLYSWGHYQELIYDSYAQPQSLNVQDQVERLEQDYQRARAANERMPPGWHAHLGHLYFQLGNTDQARREFLTEKADFPESTVLMDRLLANLK